MICNGLLDFHETFIPVAKHAFIGMLRVLAHHHKWNIYQLDVSNDFLHGHVDSTTKL
jgi:hypothetical protein